MTRKSSKEENVVQEVKIVESREQLISRIKDEMSFNLERFKPRLSQYQIDNAVKKPDISKLENAVEFTSDGEPKFKLMVGDSIIVERPYPCRQTSTVEISKVEISGYLLMWNHELNHFEAIDDWRIAEQLGILLRCPTEKKIRRIRMSKFEREMQKQKRDDFKTANMTSNSEVTPLVDTSEPDIDIVLLESSSSVLEENGDAIQ